jgi:hypothetical protein
MRAQKLAAVPETMKSRLPARRGDLFREVIRCQCSVRVQQLLRRYAFRHGKCLVPQVQVSSERGLPRFLQKAKALGFVRCRLLLDNILLGGFDGLGFARDWLFGDWFAFSTLLRLICV